ncbi:MAG TPA: hypothetical protein VNP04_14640 [Alphaproteobacteria bacterium]|nr:hypothetical protein [Alphaproteobacteria bacterium]
MTYKGIVRGNLVFLEEGAHLPDGAKVTVTVERVERAVEEKLTLGEVAERQALVARMKEFGQRLAERRVDLGGLILEGREELADRA